MKIIHVTDTSIYNYDGISTYINEILQVSEKQGDDSLVLTTTPVGKEIRNYRQQKAIKLHAFKCLRFPGKPKFVVVSSTGMKKIIDDYKPDIVWIHTIGTLGMKAARIAYGKFKIIYTKHCFDGELWNAYLNIPPVFHWFFNYVSQSLENTILKRSEKVIYHLNDVEKVQKNKYFSKFERIPPPLNTRFFQNRLVNKPKKQKLTLGFCGRAEPDKGIEHTFKGLKILKEKYQVNNFEFLFIGDGSEAHRMKAKYPEIDIKITGYIDEVIPYIDSLDAFILSSLQETISLSSLEAYARGIPLFSVAIGYLYEHREKLNNYHLFETPEQLAGLLFENLVTTEKLSANRDLHSFNNFIIDYGELCTTVKSDNLSVER